MNCKHVQELLPLYVGHDLEETCAQMVTAHLQSCAECAGSLDEYRETRQLLHQFAPPPFGEAVYAGIRQRVLREIGRESTAPGLSRLLESLFRPRLRWAVATALLLAVSVFALYFIANRTNDRQQVADIRHTVDGPTSPSIKGSEVPPPASPVKNTGPIKGLAGVTHQSQRKRTAGAPDRTDRTRPATIKSADTQPMTAQTLPDGRSEPDAVPARDSATSGKTLRMEMQTKDPNIRIIWFAPQPTKQDSQNKFSKGI